MIEVITSWDLTLGVNSDEYKDRAKGWVSDILKAPGLIEFRANRSPVSARVRVVTLWDSAEDWIRFYQSEEWARIVGELSGYTTHIVTEVWGPSPIVPEPLRP